MSDTLLHSLLALRRACAELKAEVAPPARARLDIMTTVLARLIAREQQFPRLREELLEGYAGLVAGLAEMPPAALPAVTEATEATHAGVPLEAALARIQRAIRGHGHPDGPAYPAGVELRTVARLEGAFAARCQQAILAEIDRGEGLLSAGAASSDDLDCARLRDFLIDALGEPPTLEIAGVTLASRGFSKQTLLVSLRGTARLPPEIALRVDRAFNFLGTTVVDEFEPLVALHAAGIRLPRPIALERSGRVLDGAFIVFEKCAGVLVGNNFQAPARNPALAQDVARCLAQVHRIRPDLLPGLRGNALSPRSQLRCELDKAYADWAALGRAIPLVEAAFSWLYAHEHLAHGPSAVVHGDYNFNNLLVEGDRVSAIVDWEFLHVGNPAEDLGWLYYSAQGVCGWDAFLELYERAGGLPFDRRSLGFYVLLGQTRLAVMTLQTESGFDAGRFGDLKFALASALYTNVSLARLGQLLDELI